MSRNYRSELVGAFGNPIDENPTGVMEEAAFAAAGLDYRYLTILVRAGELAAAMAGMRAMNMRGINLTIPHKVEVLKHLDELSPAAEIIGAVNTVVNNNGRLWGDNTDGKGFLQSLVEAGAPPAGKNLAILGAGGAARAIAVECALAGAARVDIVNRDAGRGRALAELISAKTKAAGVFHPWNGTVALPAGTDIVVNATPLGLYPDVAGKPDIAYDGIGKGMAACDVVFNDPNTPFLREAEKRGAQCINGLGMLVNQGALNFTLWTGAPAPRDVMVATLRREFGL
jgi:shikimate dehydrogenase